MNTFSGYKIRILRKEKGLTIQELAGLVGLSPSAIGMYERGVRKPDLSLAVKLSKLFKLNVNFFYGDEINSQTNVFEEIEECIKDVNVDVINEKEKVIKEVLKRANGYCELCNKFAPFIGNNGVPYLEISIIEPQRNIEKCDSHNFAALCPNCHKKIEVLRLKGDILYLNTKLNKK